MNNSRHTNDENKKITNEDIGFDDNFETHLKHTEGTNDLRPARVTAEYRGSYKVKNEDGEYAAKVTGKQMFESVRREDYPAVGDWVAILPINEEQAVIHTILPRKTCIKRKSINSSDTQIIAANIDAALVVESVGRDFNLNRFERYFSLANAGGITPVAVLNKIDLVSKEELDEKLGQIKKRFGDIDHTLTSIVTDGGLMELRDYIKKGKTYCFLGSSGVGKSSLINKLLGKDIIKTEDISASAERGKHITTKREMYFLKDGGIVIDNPGMREVGMSDGAAGVDDLFERDIASDAQCKFADCTHVHEPGCRVLARIKAGELDERKYSNYISLKKETEFYEMTDVEKRNKDRRFGKFIKTAKEELKKFEDR
ncbi:MAG: ribosome small subunit-dependent GTPase A [Candidatus Paceibacterota bacterium]|jgi:ribosome biogenesis GTPase|nr:ribosome small subunit-dependent GTPase A [Candidatus Paceibacterota bacterium]